MMPSGAVPARCRCWMLRPEGFEYRDICEEFTAHEFLRVGEHPMCGVCAHLRTCHEELVLVPLDLQP